MDVIKNFDLDVAGFEAGYPRSGKGDPAMQARAVELAKKHGVKVILKPCAISQMDPELLRGVNILVPNQKEASTLCPGHTSVEEQADYFLKKGIKNRYHYAGRGRLLSQDCRCG